MDPIRHATLYGVTKRVTQVTNRVTLKESLTLRPERDRPGRSNIDTEVDWSRCDQERRV